MEKIYRNKVWAAGSASVLTLLVFLTTLNNGFVNWDDNVYIYENPFIRSLDLNFLKWAFSDFRYASNWHPLAWISHALDFALWGLNPSGHHLTSALIHAANAAAVVLLSIALLDATKKNGFTPTLSSGKIVFIAGMTGLLFGLHPLRVESVAWASERKDLLCGFFFLLSMLWYLKFADSVGKNSSFKARFFNKYYGLAFGAFAMALMSKPMAVTLPVVLLLLDWIPCDRIRSQITGVALEKIPFFLTALLVSAVTVTAQIPEGQKSPELYVKLAVGNSAVLAYLWKTVAPVNLSAFYPYPPTFAFFFSQIHPATFRCNRCHGRLHLPL